MHAYGNTRETDLIDYGIRVLGKSHEELRQALDEMILYGWVERVIHDKLGSNIAYIAKGNWPLDLALSIEADALDIKDKQKIIADAKRILEEAAVIAEKRIRKKYPELYKRPKS